MRRLGLLLTTLLVASLISAPAQAAEPSSPKRFTGFAFDTCVAPSNATMDAWNVASPFAVVGIYTSGNSRYCDDSKQPHLSPAWVQRQASQGWLFMPIHVGYQAPCFVSTSNKKHLMSYNTSTARAQARADADEATSRAAAFGFARGNAIYLDIEWYNRTNIACDNAVMAFIDAFVQRAHKRGYKVGLYSSASAAIQAVDETRHQGRRGMDYPDQMWFAWTNERANTDGRPYLADTFWKRDRIHQYHNNVTVKYAGHPVLIDKNVVDVGGGSRAKQEKKMCRVEPTMKRYRTLKPGKRGDDVRLVQCLLRKQGHKAKVTGRWNKKTTRAVKSFRRDMGWSATPRVNKAVWTSLLARGSAPVLKRGKSGERVYRLQRSLRAAGQTVTVNGVFDARTTKAVRSYRRSVGLPAYQSADRLVWSALKHGRR